MAGPVSPRLAMAGAALSVVLTSVALPAEARPDEPAQANTSGDIADVVVDSRRDSLSARLIAREGNAERLARQRDEAGRREPGTEATPGPTTPPGVVVPEPPAPAPSVPPQPSPPSDGTSSGSAAAGRAAVAWAREQIGLPYAWGGAGPGSFDCSGLTMRAWERAGVGLPHSSRLQYRRVVKIAYADLRPGDLLFWARVPGDPATIHHVAVFAGGATMIEAPASGLVVREVPVRWPGMMPFAGRA